MSETAQQFQDAESSAQDKAAGAGGLDGLKDKLDVNGDGKTDADDAKSLAKDAANKVKGLLGKK